MSIKKDVFGIGALYKGERGYSAYEIAVKQGFVGTEEEWLQSLQGRSPLKGVDYWTAEEVASMKQEISNSVTEQVREFVAVSVSMRVDSGYIQWRTNDNPWQNLLAIADICNCEGGGVTPSVIPITAISIDNVGEVVDSAQLLYTLIPSNATNYDMKWSSSNTDVATVDNSGMLTVVASGTATITVKDSFTDISSSIDIECIKTPTVIPITGISADVPTEIRNGTSSTLTVSYSPQNTTQTGYVITSSDENVAKIIDGNIVNGKNIGSANIEVKSLVNSTVKTIYEIDVISPEIPITKIDIELLKNTCVPNEVIAPLIIYSPTETTQTDYNLTSSDANIAIIENNKIKALSIGEATITVTSVDNPTVSDSIGITVGKAIDSIQILTSSELSLPEQLLYELTPSDTIQRTLIWTSSDTDIATVDKDGVVTVVSAGQVTITATSKDNREVSVSKVFECSLPQVDPWGFVMADISTLEDEPIKSDVYGKYVSHIDYNVMDNYTVSQKIYYADDGTMIDDVYRMSTDELEAALGLLDGFGFSSKLYPDMMPVFGFQTKIGVLYNYSKSLKAAIGYRVPSGKYKIKLLMSISGVDSEKAKFPLNGSVSINGREHTFINKNTVDNTTWEEVSCEVTDGVIIIQCSNNNNKYISLAAVDITWIGPLDNISLDDFTILNDSITDDEQLTVSYIPASTTQKQLVWESSDRFIAAIDKLGSASVHNEGQITLTATSANDIVKTKVVQCNRSYPNPTGNYKILFIGNSFSEDVVRWCGYMSDYLGYGNTVWDNLFIGGARLDVQYGNIMRNANASILQRFIGKNDKTEVSYTGIRDLIEAEGYDFIILQQFSGYSGQYDTITPYLNPIIDELRLLSPRSRLLWHSTWAYSSDATHPYFPEYGSDQLAMYNAINSVRSNILEDYCRIFDNIPTHTAIQNARSIPQLNSKGHELTNDGGHLHPAGRIIGSYIVVTKTLCCLTGQTIDDLDYACFNGEVSSEWTEADDALAKQAIKAAIQHPDEITEIGIIA